MQAQEVQHQVPQDAIRLELTRGLCAEPALLALAALALGESMEPGQWPSYGPIFAAVAVLIADGVLRMRQHARTP